jgi:DNA-binding LacI/PurR family transcriptional regulator
MAQGAIWTLTRAGVRIPDDVAIIGFDGTAFGEFMNPTLSTMCQPFDAIARTAVDELLARVDGRPPASDSVLLSPELFIGGSSLRAHVPCPTDRRAFAYRAGS